MRDQIHERLAELRLRGMDAALMVDVDLGGIFVEGYGLAHETLGDRLCRCPDYADLLWRCGLPGGDRCVGSGIIIELPGKRAACRAVDSGRVSRSADSSLRGRAL